MFHPTYTFSLICYVRDCLPIVLGGDFNAKHKLWNNFSNNTRGVQLYKYIQKNDISLIHSDTYSYEAPHRNASNIDIFLIKDVPYNNSCYTINDLSSNHFLVLLKFDRVNLTKTELTLRKTDWSAFLDKSDK